MLLCGLNKGLCVKGWEKGLEHSICFSCHQLFFVLVASYHAYYIHETLLRLGSLSKNRSLKCLWGILLNDLGLSRQCVLLKTKSIVQRDYTAKSLFCRIRKLGQFSFFLLPPTPSFNELKKSTIIIWYWSQEVPLGYQKNLGHYYGQFFSFNYHESFCLFVSVGTCSRLPPHEYLCIDRVFWETSNH